MQDIEKMGAYVHLELRDGKLIASTGAGSDDDYFDKAAEHHANGEWVNLWLAFPISEVLDGTIESYGHGESAPHELDVEAKPKIDALRAELVAMIAKIDSLTFA